MEYNITYREKDGGIQFIISYKDQNGKWKQKSKQGFAKKGDAKKVADKMLDELKKDFRLDLNSELKGITFDKFTKMFIEHQELYKEYYTVKTYKNTIQKFNSLKDMELSEIKSPHIQECIDAMVKDGLNSSTIKTYVSKIKTVFNNAIKPHKILIQNPVADIEVPENKNNYKIKALTKVELDRLLKNIDNKSYYIISLIAAKCGLRIGEIVGLTWNDINFINGTIKINKQWKFLKTKKWGFGSTKTENSNRIVPVSKSVLRDLKKYKKYSPASIDSRIVSYVSTASVGVHLGRIYKKIGFDISVHDLRHTYATMLIAGGVDFKTAAALLGHDVEQTMKTYSHVTDDMTTKAKKIINNIFD